MRSLHVQSGVLSAVIRALLVVTCLSAAAAAEDVPLAGQSRANVRALLVGCTDYVSEDIPDLRGPENDVALLRDVLVGRFQFPDDGRAITTLTGRQATSARICAAFEELARSASAGSQIVILLSGHGAQQPDDDSDEVDGLDEVFCPIDVQYTESTGNVALGGITDDQIGRWLRAMSDRGANVWLIADSCHNGTLTRGITDLSPGAETARGIGSHGLPAGPAAGGESHESPGGRVVAFYAAPPAHKTFEATFNNQRHGVFTYTLCSILKTSTERLTYRRLIQRVHAEYAKMRRASPIPQLEAVEQDTVVLGNTQLRGSDIRLSRTADGYRVNAGLLHGVTRGTLLGVYATGEDEQPRGYVRVVHAEAARAEVEPCSHRGVNWSDSIRLPVTGFCEIAQSGLDGLTRLRVAVDRFSQQAVGQVDRRPLAADVRAYWQSQLQQIESVGGNRPQLIEVVDTVEAADWVLRPATDRQKDVVYLAPTERFAQQSGDELLLMSPTGEQQWQRWLATKLPDIARSCNLIEIAQHDAAGTSSQIGLNVELRVLQNEDDYTGVPFPAGEDPGRLPGRQLHPGDLVGLHVTNPNPFDVYVSVLYVNGQYRTQAFFPEFPGQQGHLLKAAGQDGSSFMPVRIEIDNETPGLERLVTIAVRAELNGTSPDFTFLAPTTRNKAAGRTSPLEELLQTAVHEPEAVRSRLLPNRRHEQLEPHAMNVISWVTTTSSDEEKGLFNLTGPAENLKARIVVEQGTRYHTADRTRAILGSYGRLIPGSRLRFRADRFDPRGSVLNDVPIRRWQKPFEKSGQTTLEGLASFTLKSEQWRLASVLTGGSRQTVTYSMSGQHLVKEDVINRLNADDAALEYFRYVREGGGVPCVILQNVVMSSCEVESSLLWGNKTRIQLTGGATPPETETALRSSDTHSHTTPLIRCYLMHEVILRDGRVIDLTDERTAP